MKTPCILLVLLASLLFWLPVFAQPVLLTIPEIQGNSDASAYEGSNVQTEGAVTGVYPNLNGFFIQDSIGDGDITSSDGVFVYYPNMPPLLVGDYVTIEAQVQEYFGMTELGNVTSLVIETTGVTIAPTDVVLPKPWNTTIEEFEGMYITFPQTMYVTDNYGLAQYGEVALSADFQLIQPTNVVDVNDADTIGTTISGASNVTEVVQLQLENQRRTIVLDDGNGGWWPNPIPFLNPADSTLRTGTTLDGLTGHLIYSFSRFRIVTNDSIPFNYAPRPAKPEFPAANVVVGSYNVLNFWTTLDNGTNDARGADTPAEYVRQRDKLATAINAMGADVVALMELENNTTTAIDSLVAALNAASAPGMWSGIVGTFSGGDAIQSAMVYKPSRVTPIGTPLVNTDTIFLLPTFSQGFMHNGSGEDFVLIVNHFQYKGGCGDATGANADQQDGQACWNDKRRKQSLALLSWLDTVQTHYGDNDLLIVGDFNAYAEEDPIDVLVGSPLTRITTGDHTFAFQGQYGALDHAFVNNSMIGQVVGAQVWHINSDEPRYLDYNTEDVAQDFFNASNPYRASDHDPVLVGLLLDSVVSSVAHIQASDYEMSVFPNPSNNVLTVRFCVHEPDQYSVKVYDLSGRSIANPVHRNFAAGEHLVQWNGTDAVGNRAAAGIYFLSIERAGKIMAVRKVIRE